MSGNGAEDQGSVETGAGAAPSAGSSTEREPDAIYQNGRLAARAIGPQVDLEAKEIRFQELHNSDYLVLPDECEFQKYIIMVQRVGFATKVEKDALHKGRVLRDVVAEILRYREQ